MTIKDLVKENLALIGITINGNAPFDIRVYDDDFYRQIGMNPSLGAGESYMMGLWDCEKLDELMYRVTRQQIDEKMVNGGYKTIKTLFNQIANLQTKFKSQKVADVHYNLGNELYESMLGPSMAYSCGYWNQANNLEEAQEKKFDLICRKINLKQGDLVLDIGSGFGCLAKYMATHYKAEVVALTISSQQIQYAKHTCKDLPVTFHLCDYRDEMTYNPKNILFDKITSVGMFEHVGYKNYHEFMKIAKRQLKEEGLFLLHTIGKNNSQGYLDAWIDKYIFPNGMLPSVKRIAESVEDLFVIEDLHNFGADYDKTLMAWHKNFNDSWLKLKDKYDSRFYRMWNYYLLTNAGAFRARQLQLWQIVLSPNGVLGGYQRIN